MERTYSFELAFAMLVIFLAGAACGLANGAFWDWRRWPYWAR
jgi:ribose/xylose/arabinose/galactoside ABC-type transport system permease subunit